VIDTLAKAATMKLRLPLLALPFGMLTVINCGARTPMDSLAGQGSEDTGGSSGSGGYWVATGGNHGGGGINFNTGGSIVGSGGYVDGGGGRYGGGGSVVIGGRGGSNMGGTTFNTGGAVATGGRIGGAGGSIVRDGGPEVRPDSGVDVRDSGRDIFATGGTAGAVGTGGALGSGGNIGSDASVCPGLEYNEELIDDLNDGDRFIPSINGRVGAWTGSHDNSPDGKMSPDPNGSFAPTSSGDPCRKYAMYVSGGGYVLWGADFWFGLGSPYDASKYTGISFWAKIDAGTSSVVRVNFPDKDTQPDGNLCSTASNAGADACYDHYGYRITLSSTWTKYTIMFSQLATQNWGRGGSGFDPASLYQVLFQIPTGATFGIWVDDPAFTSPPYSIIFN
jgi:hypothetical protein